ncbi:MAG: hypothetical protein NTY09_09195 [bacterium]|nr:hypothetical protein [bacterium]
MQTEIISKFREKPKTKTAWWAMWLGLATIFVFLMLGIYGAFIIHIIINTSSENTGSGIGFWLGFLAIILSVSALIVSILAYDKGERSWVLWVGFIPAIMIGASLFFMVIANFYLPH